ncbi:MAG: endonuclease/exonuclease/phosphatase family protein [Saprospiraceae bacterium]|nr:endonuclease/exonuclease/phosphatase family protein [Saprospiraceae bacterium]
MWYRVFLVLTVLLNCFHGQLSSQSKYKIVSGGFYNLENLFDTEDDTLINDEEFLPDGARAWTTERYEEKLANMAYVISQIGVEDVKAGLSFLGVSEIENRRVLEDLVKQASIAGRNYQIIHYDSPDGRGVDVGLLYNPSHFIPMYSRPIPLFNYEGDKRRFTRDVLYVKGMLEEDTLHILVNHWPSRGGGPATVEYRNNGARLCRSVIDSVLLVDPKAKVLVMGDLNDDPVDESIKKYLRAVRDVEDVRSTGVYNPYEALFQKGLGSNAYRDTWSLFDQIILTQSLTEKKQSGYAFFKAQVFSAPFLVQSSGAYKGYPFRTFSGDSYQGGYSDHFPSFIYLIKKI